ncbi:MAG: hypothetical protein ABIW46_03190 [Acidimicrobiales bacterium]
MLTRRLQVLLEESQWQRLARRAEAQGASVAALVREAIERSYPDDTEHPRDAAEQILSARPMPVDDWDAMKAEVVEASTGAV